MNRGRIAADAADANMKSTVITDLTPAAIAELLASFTSAGAAKVLAAAPAAAVAAAASRSRFEAGPPPGSAKAPSSSSTGCLTPRSHT